MAEERRALLPIGGKAQEREMCSITAKENIFHAFMVWYEGGHGGASIDVDCITPKVVSLFHLDSSAVENEIHCKLTLS